MTDDIDALVARLESKLEAALVAAKDARRRLAEDRAEHEQILHEWHECGEYKAKLEVAQEALNKLKNSGCDHYRDTCCGGAYSNVARAALEHCDSIPRAYKEQALVRDATLIEAIDCAIAKEREACARICDETALNWRESAKESDTAARTVLTAEVHAKLIRARGEK